MRNFTDTNKTNVAKVKQGGKTGILLSTLKPHQINEYKSQFDGRSKPTHAVVIPGVGSMVGTEKQMRKYFTAWGPDGIFN